MSSFTKHPDLKALLDGINWEVREPFEYRVGSEDSNEVIRIPKGFITDGASIPKIFWSIIGGPWGKYGYAAVVHDYLYHTKKYTRKKSDQIFLEAMKVLGVSWWKRRIMYQAVRWAGWIPWKKHKVNTGVAVALLGLLCVSGCASLGITYDNKGQVTKVESTGIQDTEIICKDGTIIKRKCAVELWPSNLFTIYKD